eukprot:CAMPEP_0197523764 /NCGR_PEP_ID=MMETSP1318-20131121/8578_1 /TAXON_ID=552666 /ORGANISM="Partenskyella glossopodia, Strain RCC365" /LENGTH=717 /DNA_ID=CAMNT_0043076555 /DNA_START=21 /DNA_END=2174 /DNA_ORIENTATION=+
MTIPCTISVQEAARKMGSVRADAALVTLNGEVCGIITDSDITRRVVAVGKAASSTPVSLVMTGSPLTMKPSDPAFEALSTMVGRHFRHMPVMRNKSSSSVVGLLDINKCLSDAIKRNEGKDALKGGVFSGLNFTLESVVNGADEAPFVYDKDPVIEAAKVMAKLRKTAVLVKDFNKTVVGILTTKDIMLRVVAARLMPHSTTVARVMTPHPDTVPHVITVGTALKQMRSKRYLHLPVACDEEGKDVIGLVDALELCMIVLKPECAKENDNDSEGGLRGVLEGLWTGGDSVGSDSESVAGSVTEDSRFGTPTNRSRTPSVAPPSAHKRMLLGDRSSIAEEERKSVASVESKKLAESAAAQATGQMFDKVESVVSDLSKSISENASSGFKGLESRLTGSIAEMSNGITSKIEKEVKDIKTILNGISINSESAVKSGGSSVSAGMSPGGSAADNIQLITKLENLPKVLQSDMKALLDTVHEKLDRLDKSVRKQDMQSSTQLDVIRNLTSSLGQIKTATTGAAPMAIQPLIDMMAKNRASLMEETSTLKSQVSSSMTKIERMVSETNTTLTKLASASAAMPDIVKTAVARANRPSFSGKSPLETKSQGSGAAATVSAVVDASAVNDAAGKIAFQTVEIVRSKINTIQDITKHSNSEVTASQGRLVKSVEQLKDTLMARVDKTIDDRVQTKVENELIKVAGGSAVAGMFLGMLGVMLFAPKK